MELYHLRSFVAVAEEGNLSRAALRLYLSQPAISAHIKALEDELGVALFTRSAKGMQPTPDGLALKATAEKALTSAAEVLEQARSRQATLSGPMRVGLNSDPDFLRTSTFMAALLTRHPKVEIHFVNRNSGQLLDDLRQGDLDGTFAFGEVRHPEVGSLVLGQVRVAVAGPLAWKERMEAADLVDLARLPWIGVPEYCPYCEILFRVLRERGAPTPTFGLTDCEFVLLAMASTGQGLCLTREDLGLAAEARGEVALWRKEVFELPFGFAYLKARSEDRRVVALLDAVRRVWPDAQ